MRRIMVIPFILFWMLVFVIALRVPCYGSDCYIHVDIMKSDGTYMMWKEGEVGEIEEEVIFYPSVKTSYESDNTDRRIVYQIICNDKTITEGLVAKGDGISVFEDSTVRFYIKDINDNIIETSRDYKLKNKRRTSLLANLKSILISVISI